MRTGAGARLHPDGVRRGTRSGPSLHATATRSMRARRAHRARLRRHRRAPSATPAAAPCTSATRWAAGSACASRSTARTSSPGWFWSARSPGIADRRRACRPPRRRRASSPDELERDGRGTVPRAAGSRSRSSRRSPCDRRRPRGRARGNIGGTRWSTQLRALGQGAQEPLWDRLAELTMPFVPIGVERSTRSTWRSRARMAAAIGDRSRSVDPARGHALHLEQPEAVATRPRPARVTSSPRSERAVSGSGTTAADAQQAVLGDERLGDDVAARHARPRGRRRSAARAARPRARAPRRSRSTSPASTSTIAGTPAASATRSAARTPPSGWTFSTTASAASSACEPARVVDRPDALVGRDRDVDLPSHRGKLLDRRNRLLDELEVEAGELA